VQRLALRRARGTTGDHAPMYTIRHEKPADIAAREALLDLAYGPVRFSKTSELLRAGRAPAAGLSFVAVEDGRVVGTIRLWTVSAGVDRPALLLGPLAVHPASRNRGIGSALVCHALSSARRLGHRAVLLVGDAAYYGRFGFSAERTGTLWLPGPYEPHRLLSLELDAAALEGARGLIKASKSATKWPVRTLGRRGRWPKPQAA
jgi:predicted N-acetyltransferase YhbS